jgi:hypothetical protein
MVQETSQYSGSGWMPVQATVIAHHPTWAKPVIPVVAGITGWPAVEDGSFTRWTARPGAVVLELWERYWRRGPEDPAGDDELRLEVVLPLDADYGLLLELVMRGTGTLAVLEFRSEYEPPEWTTRELDTEGLREAIEEATRRRGENEVPHGTQ